MMEKTEFDKINQLHAELQASIKRTQMPSAMEDYLRQDGFESRMVVDKEKDRMVVVFRGTRDEVAFAVKGFDPYRVGCE